jgi:MoaA/NifB/PqqE/SkfB family radical SAM enzyme
MIIRNLKIAGKYIYSHQVTHRPIILTHAVTRRCNCSCKICDTWRRPQNHDEMKTGDIFRMLDQAASSGFVAYIAFGGEPLMRNDIAEILGHAHTLGLYTIIITNGYLLKEKADDLAGITDLTIVSLDDEGTAHDNLRGVDGLSQRVLGGITAMRKQGARIALNCVLSRFSLGAERRMISFAMNHGLKIAFDPMEPFSGINDEGVMNDEECRQVFSNLLNQKQLGAPILNSDRFLMHQISPIPYTCAQPRIFLRVAEEGTIHPFWCRKTDHILGDVQKQSLKEIIDSPAWKKFDATAQECNLCMNSSTVESSLFYYAGFWASRRYLKFASDYAL